MIGVSVAALYGFELRDVSVLSAVAVPMYFDTEFLGLAFRCLVEGVDVTDVVPVFGLHLDGIEFLEAVGVFDALVWAFESGCGLDGLETAKIAAVSIADGVDC